MNLPPENMDQAYFDPRDLIVKSSRILTRNNPAHISNNDGS